MTERPTADSNFLFEKTVHGPGQAPAAGTCKVRRMGGPGAWGVPLSPSASFVLFFFLGRRKLCPGLVRAPPTGTLSALPALTKCKIILQPSFSGEWRARG